MSFIRLGTKAKGQVLAKNMRAIYTIPVDANAGLGTVALDTNKITRKLNTMIGEFLEERAKQMLVYNALERNNLHSFSSRQLISASA